MKKKLIYFLLTLGALSLAGRAQVFLFPGQEENQAWSGLYLKVQKNRYTFLTEIQARGLLDLSQWRTLASRTGVFYLHGRGFKSGAGLAEFNSSINGEFRFRTEFRLWQETGHEFAKGKFSFSNRLRLEQRWIENAGEKFDFYLRARFRNEVNWRVKDDENVKGGIQLQLGNEFLVQQGNGSGFQTDHDRLYTGVSYTFAKGVNVQSQYIFVPYLRRLNGATQHQNIVRINLFFSL